MNKYLESFVPTQDLVERRKRRKIRVNFVLFALGTYIACVFLYMGYVAFRNGTDVSNTPLPEHNNLFIKEIQNQLVAPFVYKSKIREPESNYNLNNGFHLTVKKVKINSDKPLNEILIMQEKQSEHSTQVSSSYADDSFLHLSSGEEKIDIVSNVNFKYRGGLTKVAGNDSLACYYMKFKDFSISYDGSSDYDIWGETKGLDNAVISLAFLKKKKALYIIMLFKMQNENLDFQQNMLYNFMKK